MAQLGFIPRAAESFEYGLYRFSVMEMDGRRVARVKFRGCARRAEEAELRRGCLRFCGRFRDENRPRIER